MRRYSILLLVVAVVGCSDKPTAPAADRTPTLAVAAEEASGPPSRHDFGPDSYRTGLFTGQGTTRPGLDSTARRLLDEAAADFSRVASMVPSST